MSMWIWVVVAVVAIVAVLWLSWWRAGRKEPDGMDVQTKSGRFGNAVETGFWGKPKD